MRERAIFVRTAGRFTFGYPFSLPLYVAPMANGGSDANAAAANQPDLTAALNGWLESSARVRAAVGALVQKGVDTGRK